MRNVRHVHELLLNLEAEAKVRVYDFVTTAGSGVALGCCRPNRSRWTCRGWCGCIRGRYRLGEYPAMMHWADKVEHRLSADRIRLTGEGDHSYPRVQDIKRNLFFNQVPLEFGNLSLGRLASLQVC